MIEKQNNSEILTDVENPVISMPVRLIPTISNYGTMRFRHNEVIVCKDVAFMITFISNKKLSLKLLPKEVADKFTGKQQIIEPG